MPQISIDEIFTHADSLQLDHDACGNLNSMIIPCCGDLRELKGGHYHRIVEISENAGKCLLSEYTVRDFKFQFLSMHICSIDLGNKKSASSRSCLEKRMYIKYLFFVFLKEKSVISGCWILIFVC